MKIQFNYPNGYASQMTDARENGRFEEWIQTKFGSRISDLITESFTLDINDSHFIADFEYDADGNEFLRLIGGRIVD